METRKRKIVLITAVLMALLAVVSFYVKSDSEKTMVTRIVAGSDIPEGTVLTEDMITETDVNPGQVIEGSTDNLNKYVGRRTVAAIAKGEQILDIRLTGTKVKGDTVADNLPARYRAIGVPTTMANSVGGQVNPGDTVTVNAIDDAANTLMLAPSAKVIRLINKDGSVVSAKQPGTSDKLNTQKPVMEPVVAVLRVTPEEAQAISGCSLQQIVLVLKGAE